MAKVNLVSKKVKMTLTDIIKYQLITYCYINKITLNESDLTCLTLLGVSGKYNLTDFCMFASQQNIFKNPQSVRNCLVKLEKHDLIQKERKNKKIISLSSDINVQVAGNIVLDYKIVHIATT